MSRRLQSDLGRKSPPLGVHCNGEPVSSGHDTRNCATGHNLLGRCHHLLRESQRCLIRRAVQCRHIGSGTIASGIRKEAGTIARGLAAVASWYRLLVDEEVRTTSPAEHVRRPRLSDDGETPGLTRDELRRLMTAARDHGSLRSVALVPQTLLLWPDVPLAPTEASSPTQTREYPTTGHAAAASGGWLGAAVRSVFRRLGR